ncbi:ABC transporter substrate-binding protein [Natrialba taiwanensis]|nr:ABC transporter substrate-binding protein [Natrialba taiwanensis]
MNSPPDESDESTKGISRRAMLAAGATGLSIGASGCINRVQSVVDPNSSTGMSVSILTLPGADGDREGAQIARHLEENLRSVGVNATINTRSRSELLETVLLDQDFDIYVGRHPADFNPDFFYEALHSTYAYESGWQNPFKFMDPSFDSEVRFTDPSFDGALERQRTVEGAEREDAIAELLWRFALEQPFIPVCIPNEYRLVQTDRFSGWEDGHLATRLGYLGLEPAADVEQLHALITDARPTRNLNPLSATARERGTVTDLLYDSLATYEETDDDSESNLRPWLAADWEWDGSTATIELREGCTFHNGDPLTAQDVEFTYQFLADTTLGRAPEASPAPRYRGQVAAVDSIAVEDDYHLTISASTSPEVGERAFTVPILPRRIWSERVDTRVTGNDEFSPPQGTWSLVTANNIPPVGSGPFQFADRSQGEFLLLERFEDHFSVGTDGVPEPTVPELRLEVDPGTASSIDRITSGGADMTTARLETYALGGISDDAPVERVEDTSWTFYHIGFNTLKEPFSNPRFRRAVARLVDKGWITETVFNGHARPVAAPVAEKWTPDSDSEVDSLVWEDKDPVTPFLGTDGELDVKAARSLFAEDYEYDDNGNLLR